MASKKKLVIKLAERVSLKGEKRVIQAYVKALADVRAEIELIYSKYSVNGVIKYADMMKSDGALLSRYETMYTNIFNIIKKNYKTVSANIDNTFKMTFKEGYNYKSYDIQNQIGKELSFSAIPENIVKQAAMNPISGLTLKEIATKDKARVLNDINTAITRGLVQGSSINQMDKLVKEALGAASNNSERIVRTEALRAYSLGQLHSENEAKSMGIKLTKTWSATLDDRTRQTHQDMNGLQADEDGMFTITSGPNKGAQAEEPRMFGIAAEDIQCVPGYSRILAKGITKIFKRKYSGNIIKIKTAFGSNFEITPNHPILTDKGWIEARFLNKRSNIISKRFVKISSVFQFNVQNSPSMISQIFDFLKIIFSSETKCGIKKQFHGDGFTSNVNIVSINSKLLNCINTSSFNPIIQLNFSKSYISKFILFLYCSFIKFLNWTFNSSDSIMGIISKIFSIFRSTTRHAQKHAFASVSGFNTVFDKDSFNNITRITDLLRNEFYRFSKNDILLDQIIDIQVSNFIGHVYNLQTKNGLYELYNDNNILSIIHNCRCTCNTEVQGYEDVEKMDKLKSFDYKDYETYKAERVRPGE